LRLMASFTYVGLSNGRSATLAPEPPKDATRA
jgi:hypothetical protein